MGGAGAAEEMRSADKAARLARAMSRHGRRPHLSITGALSTFAGLDDLPGHLDGHGVITAELLRSIGVSWGTLTTVGVDAATGTATSVGALTYRPRQRLSDQVITLSGTCRTAGCRMPTWRCDIDHVEPFNHADPRAGGKTSLSETIPACRFHHLLKHHTNGAPHLQPDLSILWTTNTGHLAISHAREFTLPGEWLRRESANADASGPGEAEQLVEDGSPGAATVAVPASPESIRVEVMVGPTVAGRTSVPHPGSMEIHAYRGAAAPTRTPRPPDPKYQTAERPRATGETRIHGWPAGRHSTGRPRQRQRRAGDAHRELAHCAAAARSSDPPPRPPAPECANRRVTSREPNREAATSGRAAILTAGSPGPAWVGRIALLA